MAFRPLPPLSGSRAWAPWVSLVAVTARSRPPAFWKYSPMRLSLVPSVWASAVSMKFPPRSR
jgi:hypothetical protein